MDYYPAAPTRILKLLEYVRPYRLQAKLMRPSFGRVRVRVPGQETTGYVLEFREFLNAVAEGREPAATAHDARRDLEIVLRTYESLETAKKVEIG